MLAGLFIAKAQTQYQQLTIAVKQGLEEEYWWQEEEEEEEEEICAQ